MKPENLSIEMYLKFNLGPLHLLDNFVKEIRASDSTKSYLRKEQAKLKVKFYYKIDISFPLG